LKIKRHTKTKPLTGHKLDDMDNGLSNNELQAAMKQLKDGTLQEYDDGKDWCVIAGHMPKLKKMHPESLAGSGALPVIDARLCGASATSVLIIGLITIWKDGFFTAGFSPTHYPTKVDRDASNYVSRN